MKKIYTILLIIAFGFSANANPVEAEPLKISELFFDESGNWHIELIYYIEYYKDGAFQDSVFLQSSTHSVQLPPYSFPDSEGVFVITADDLDEEFQISRDGDFLKIVSYNWGYPTEDKLIFGNYPDASIGSPKEGQSLALQESFRNQEVFSKDNSPSLGFPNDTLGMCGTLRGTIYDMENEPVKNRGFILDFFFETDEQGKFEARVLSKPSMYNGITHLPYKWIQAEPYDYVMEPDSVVEVDIRLLSELPSGISQEEIANSPISFYPNPVVKNEKINMHIDLPVNSANISIEIIDISGRIVKTKKAASNNNYITAPDRAGSYIIRAMMDGKPISSHKIIVNE